MSARTLRDYQDRGYLVFLQWQCGAFASALNRALEGVQAILLDRALAGQLNSPVLQQTFSDFQSAFVFAANVSKMLWPSATGRDPRQAKRRANHLRTSMRITNEPILRDKLIRNYFEHLDERLDHWQKTTMRRNILFHRIAPEIYDQGVDPVDRFDRYDPSTKRFSMLDHSIDIEALSAAVQRVLVATDRGLADIEQRLLLP